jgi:lipoate-protein ligase A
LRHDDRNWAIVGTHDAWPHKYLTTPTDDVPLPKYMMDDAEQQQQQEQQQQHSYSSLRPSTDCMIVMGIGGKPERLLNIPLVKEQKVLVMKRFSGGGTVVLDTNSLWTTLIGRTVDFPDVEPYPRSIMEWSARDIFQPTFEHMTRNNKNNNFVGGSGNTLVPDTKSCSPTENIGKMIRRPNNNNNNNDDDNTVFPKFELRENDYVFGDKKVAGNAQSIVKGGWLHHTSFLWDFDSDNMRYLTLPDKRPDYRGDRSHDDFLVRLSEFYGRSHRPFVRGMHEACQDHFGEGQVEQVRLSQVMEEVIQGKLGGMKEWFAKNRTRIVDDF